MAQENNTVSLTFGDAGENHVGMEMIGKLGAPGSGFSLDEVRALATQLGGEFADFGNGAGIAVLRGYGLREHDGIAREMDTFEWDAKYWDTRRKKVLNKRARTNVCFEAGRAQEPDFENKKGRIVDIETLPQLADFRQRMFRDFSGVIGPEKIRDLICEGNRYADNTKCGIGYHGDAERRRVVALRVGADMPMKWQWFHRSSPVGEPFSFVFAGGDVYVMSEKAVGADWRSPSILTLRHAAGAPKYTTLQPPKIKKDQGMAQETAQEQPQEMAQEQPQAKEPEPEPEPRENARESPESSDADEAPARKKTKHREAKETRERAREAIQHANAVIAHANAIISQANADIARANADIARDKRERRQKRKERE